jgi:hypothetical protein
MVSGLASSVRPEQLHKISKIRVLLKNYARDTTPPPINIKINLHRDDSAYTKSAYNVSSNSNLSVDKRKSPARECKKSQCSKLQGGRRKQKKEKDDEPKKNTCPHCKKIHRKKPHQVEPDKCMWNKKYKGYCFKSICNKLEVAFKPCHKFLMELGRCASKGNESGDN